VILDKLKFLREKLGQNAEESSLAELTLWEKQIKEAMIMEDLRQHEGVKKLLEGANGWLKKFDIELSTNQQLTQAERDRFFDRKEMFIWLIGLFDTNYLSSIEKDIDDNLNQ